MISVSRHNPLSIKLPALIGAITFIIMLLYGYWIYSLILIPAFVIFSSKSAIPVAILFKYLMATIIICISFSVGVPNDSFISQSELANNQNNIFQRYRMTETKYYLNTIKLLVYPTLFGLSGYMISRSMLATTEKIWISLLFALISTQMLIYKSTGVMTDWALGGVESRFGLNGYYRPTVFYFEPTSLAIVVNFLMLSLYVKSRLTILTFFMAFGTIIISKSMAGLSLFIMFSLVLMYYEKINIWRIIAIVLIVLILFYVSDVSTSVYERLFVNRDMSMMYRLTSVVKFFSEFTILRQVIGSGLNFNDCACLLYDTPLAWVFLYSMGFFGILFIINLYYGLSFKNKLALTVFLVIPEPITSPIIWFWLGAVLELKRRNLGHEKF